MKAIRSRLHDKAVQNMVDFLEKGGEVDCVVPDEDEGQEGEPKPEHRELRELSDCVKSPGSSGFRTCTFWSGSVEGLGCRPKNRIRVI
jgi:hypothetical protein